MPRRNLFNKQNYLFECGKIGRLKGLKVFNVLAGESFSMDLQAAFRLSPLERALVMDCRIDLACFAVPHRHIYGFDDWENFLQAGEKETITFPHVQNGAENTRGTERAYLGCGDLSSIRQLPKWLVEGFNRIYGRFFVHPGFSDMDVHDEYYNDDLPTTLDGSDFGPYVGRLRRPWSVGMNKARHLRGVAERQAQASVSGSTATMDVIDVTAARAMYGRAVTEQYYGRRPVDLLRQIWGGNMSADADERPILLGRSTQWMSGYDVNGTAETTLGDFKGKADTICGLHIPMKFCPEHAAVFVVACLRFPPVHKDELQYLVRTPNPGYAEFTGDPIVLRTKPPREYFVREFFGNASNPDGSLGIRPDFEHLRYIPSHVHPHFQRSDTWPFLRFTTQNTSHRTFTRDENVDDWNNLFSNRELGHWQAYGNMDLAVKSYVPTAEEALYIGVKR